MSSSKNPSDAEPEAPKRAKQARPYQRPRILSREPLEAMAVTCTSGGRGKASTAVCGVAKS